MPTPLLLLPGNGSLQYQDRSGVGTATGAGALSYAAGPFPGSQGFSVWEGTTNSVVNPRAANDLTNWSSDGTCAVTRDATVGRSGATSARISTPGTGDYEYVVIASADGAFGGSQTARTFVGALYVKGSGRVVAWTQAVYDTGKTDGAESASLALTGGWQRLVTPPVTTGTASPLSSVRLGVATPDISHLVQTYWATDAQIEEKPYATPYCDGSLGAGYAWTGAANASASTRSAASVTLPAAGHGDGAQASVAVWAKQGSGGGPDAYLFSIGTDAASEFYGIRSDRQSHPATPLAFVANNASNQREVSPHLALSADVWHLVYAAWTPTQLVLAADGGSPTTMARAQAINGLAGQQVSVGGASVGQGDCTIGPVAIFDRPLTDAERVKLSTLGTEWTFGMLQPTFGGVLRVASASPLAVARGVRPSPLAIGRTAR